MVKALIVGAGAIGRGFLPWCFPSSTEIFFVDTNAEMVECCREKGGYTTYMSKNNRLESLFVKNSVFLTNNELSEEILKDFDIAFLSVGPRNVEHVPLILHKLNCPLFSLENDPATVDRLREILAKDDIYFGIPDVITSCTSSAEHREQDPWSVHTEHGVLYLDASGRAAMLKDIPLKAVWSDYARISLEWDAKLYIHNTPHCIAAYLGYQRGCKFMHEAMAMPSVKTIVNGVIEEVLAALVETKKYDSEFLNNYAEKELSRFEDKLLFDPIERVARHPLRKLRPRPHGRLVGALELCLINGVYPSNLLKGIGAALAYHNPLDSDYESLSLIRYYGLPAFLWHYLSVIPGSIVSQLIEKEFSKIEYEAVK